MYLTTVTSSWLHCLGCNFLITTSCGNSFIIYPYQHCFVYSIQMTIQIIIKHSMILLKMAIFHEPYYMTFMPLSTVLYCSILNPGIYLSQPILITSHHISVKQECFFLIHLCHYYNQVKNKQMTCHIGRFHHFILWSIEITVYHTSRR